MAKNTEERLDEAHMERVISILEPKDGSKGGTKKEACQILGIAYNTTRLNTLIEKYKTDKIKDAERRAKLRGKPATSDEITYIISEYLEGATIDGITKSTYRSASFVKHILEKYSVPIRSTSYNYFKPELIPEGAMRQRFVVGEKVYSAKYDSVAIIEKEYPHKEYGWIYRIWLVADKWKQYAHQELYELASLAHLKELGVKI